MSDEFARQAAIANHSDTILVEAGAGTGKTTLLVDRIYQLIERGVEVEKIAAVTFTVKAAGELKERLRKKLKAGQSEYVKKAAQNLDRMTVNTIHGLAADLLRTLPVEAKLPPEFVALDDLQQTAAVAAFRTDWLMRALDGDTPQALELAGYIGIDLLGSENKGLSKLFDVLNKSLVDLDRVTTGDVAAQDHLDVLQYIQRQINALAGLAIHCKKQDDTLYKLIARLISWINQIPATLLSREGIEWLKSISFGRGSGSKANWMSETALTEAKDIRAALELNIDSVKQLITSLICNAIVKWITPAILDFRKHLRDSGAVGFDDLLILSRDMLRDSRTARDYFKARYDFIHIDEFQDTDPIQVEILFYLCEAEASHSHSWNDVTLKPGKLFIVGDPKQSIYRFRGADVRIYNHVARTIEEKGRKLLITRNFRSRPTILSEVNAIFAPVMLGKMDDEALYEPLIPSDSAVHDPSAVQLLLPPDGYECSMMTASQSAAQEAAAIADHIESLKASDDKVKYSHSAILMRSGTRISELQDALNARGIPFISFMNSAFTSRVEIEAVVTIMSAIANPQHTVAVIGTLRSPWFALSDDEIFEHKLSGGTFVYTDGQPSHTKAGEALLDLKRWHTRSQQIEPSALVEELLAAFSIDILFGMKSEGALRVQNIQTLIDLIRRLEQGGIQTLSGVLDCVTDMTRLVQSTELEARDENRDAVQILTLHKSKGLEFENVYLFNYREKRQSAGEWLLLKSLGNELHQLGLCASKSSGFCTLNWEMVEGVCKTAEEKELQRLLYVGMTRARSKLILPLGWSRQTAKNPSPAIPTALLARYPLNENARPSTVNTDAVETISEATVQKSFKPLALQLSIQANTAESSALKHKSWRARLDERLEHLNPVVPHDEERSEVSWQRVRARKIGVFVHAVLEHVAKNKSPDEAKQLAARSTSLSPDEQTESNNIIAAVLLSDLFINELPRAREVVTELPILEDHSNFVAARFVDLMFQAKNGEWILVDYKTDDIVPQAVTERVEHHREQLMQYGQMFERITGHRPAETRLYFVRPNVMVNL